MPARLLSLLVLATKDPIVYMSSCTRMLASAQEEVKCCWFTCHFLFTKWAQPIAGLGLVIPQLLDTSLTHIGMPARLEHHTLAVFLESFLGLQIAKHTHCGSLGVNRLCAEAERAIHSEGLACIVTWQEMSPADLHSKIGKTASCIEPENQ